MAVAEDMRTGFEIFSADLPVPGASGVGSGSSICTGLTVFHDGLPEAICWTQAGGLALTVYRFGGSYVSLAAALSPRDIAGLGSGGDLVLDLAGFASRQLAVFLRLNVTGQGRDDVLHERLIFGAGPRTVRFDLDGLGLSRGEARNAWVDVIFSRPEMSEIVLTGLAMAVVVKGRGTQ